MSRSRTVDLASSYSLSHFYVIFNLLFNFQFLESRVRIRVTINQRCHRSQDKKRI